MTKTRKRKQSNPNPNKLIRQNPECEGLTFQECERVILYNVVDRLEREQGKQLLEQPSVQEIIHTLEAFLRKKKRICYGGTAINNLLPKEEQFYNLEYEFPDYDFYSPYPIEDAKALADGFANAGYRNVEAKAGMHFGTYKVYVDFIQVADITRMSLGLYRSLQQKTIVKDGIHYAPPNFLRMSMYLELSRPHGAITRWEKVYNRLNLLNKHYPLKGEDCLTKQGKLQKSVEIQRKESELPDAVLSKIYHHTRNALIDRQVVFFGAYAHQLYSKYMPRTLRRKQQSIPDFDVLCETIDEVANELVASLSSLLTSSFKESYQVSAIRHQGVGELLPDHIQVKVNDESVCFLYEPIACHSYNTVKQHGAELRVATIDTMLSFYLAFIFMNKPYYDEKRILCMSDFLYRVQERNRLAQKGVLKRFTMSCYGYQKTVRDIRAEKTNKYRQLRKTIRKQRQQIVNVKKLEEIQKEYEEWFFKYIPQQTPDASKHLSIISI